MRTYSAWPLIMIVYIVFAQTMSVFVLENNGSICLLVILLSCVFVWCVHFIPSGPYLHLSILLAKGLVVLCHCLVPFMRRTRV